MESKTSAEQILDNIFSIMQRLYNEMRLNESGKNNHLEVFEIFAELGRTLARAVREIFSRNKNIAFAKIGDEIFL